MGLFGSKKIYVSSSVRNLAGDVLERPSYLKSVVNSNILLGQGASMGDVIRESYLKGPGIRLRSFYKWSRVPGRLDEIGIPMGTYLANSAADGNSVATAAEAVLGFPVIAHVNTIGAPDYMYWAEQWLLNNYPAEFTNDWLAEYNETTEQIDILFEDNSSHSFTPVGYSNIGQFIYIAYNEILSGGGYGPDQLLIYEVGSGNTYFDTLQLGITPTELLPAGYFPIIPFRLENQFLSATHEPDAYDEAKSAFKKAFGSKQAYDDIIEQITELENLGDIDHAYVMFGVSINVQDKDSRRYMYEFLKRASETMEDGGFGGSVDYDNWTGTYFASEDKRNVYREWDDGIIDPEDPENPPAPSLDNSPMIPVRKIKILGSNNLGGQLDMEISWLSMTQVTGTGLGKPDAEVGEIWFVPQGEDVFTRTLLRSGSVDNTVVGKHRLYHQTSVDTWEALDIVGLLHRNFIYKGKFVETTLQEALDDTEESGFVIPLNYEIMTSISLIDSTQLATACCMVVFNSYLVVKTGLLGSLFFKIIIMIVVAVVMNAILPGSGAVAANSLAATLGLSGIAAVIVNAAVSLLAAMLISAVINPIAKAVFGAKIGALIGSIVSFIASMYAGSFINSGSMTIHWGNMGSAANLMQLGNAVGNAYSAYMQASIQSMAVDHAKFMDEYKEKMGDLQERFAEEFGYGRGIIDPMMLTGSDRLVIESPDMFLSRTLLTGSDIAELSMNMISDFASLTSSVKLPLVE